MGKRLTDNLSSLYIGAANKLRSNKTRRKIVAYVESYDDILFWRTVLKAHETDEYYFEVMLPSKTSLQRGKKAALMNVLGESQLGENMVACVDADYDYMLQGRTPTSRMILESPYVFHTYVYAIENYQCCAESLHDVCVMVTLNDHEVFNFVEFMKIYSQIIYPLFIWSVWIYRSNRYKEFPLMDFCDEVRIDGFNIYSPEKCIERLRHRVNKKVAFMQKHYPNARHDFVPLKEELEKLGVHPENTYLFIQGHFLMNNVVIKILEPVCAMLRRERENEIRQSSGHDKQKYNELTCYERSLGSVDTMLRKNTQFVSLPIYKKMNEKIDTFLTLGMKKNVIFASE
ncbi:MAG: DUF4435 domain-containing protein [Bacteroidaceae bacterium]|nr:DUF4435 domain-containing protein [Bacteroidaceae bacterium]